MTKVFLKFKLHQFKPLLNSEVHHEHIIGTPVDDYAVQILNPFIGPTKRGGFMQCFDGYVTSRLPPNLD